MTLVCGVDSSTQSTKVELRRTDTGKLVASGSAPHPATTPPSSEQDPGAWWDALMQALSQVHEHLGDVTAMSVAGQQHGLVVIDDEGAVIRPAKLWNDTTSAPQADRLRNAMQATAWANRCGLVPVASFTITKLAWLAENEPENLARVARVMLPHDYLTWFLTGEHVTDRGDASGTGWWNAKTGYRADLLDHAVPNSDEWLSRLPKVLGPTAAAGTLRPAIASALGMRDDVLVGPGTGDNMAAALGLGLEPRDVAISLGTSGTAYAVSSRPVIDPTGAVAGFADATGNFLPLIATLNATKVTNTIASWLGTDASGLGELAMSTDAAADGPVLVPYFDGERTPNLPEATGEFVGLRTSTTRAQIARAAHTGVVCGLLAGVDALISADVDVTGTLRLVGGGARSAAYQQILADLWRRPVSVHAEGELVATGACVQAAAIAIDAPIADIPSSWNLKEATRVEPTRGVDAAAIRQAFTEASNRIQRDFASADQGDSETR